MKLRLVLFPLLSVVFSTISCKTTEPKTTKEYNYGKENEAKTTKKLVLSAVRYVETHGLENAVKEFNKSDGEFTRGETYVFVINNDGLLLANRGQPELVGQNVFYMKDIRGNFLIQKLIEKAKAGGGWVSYYWQNPILKSPGCKASYVKAIQDYYVVGSGFYHDTDQNGNCTAPSSDE